MTAMKTAWTLMIAGASTAMLSACITVAPQTTAGKTATKTAGLVQKIIPANKKPTMIIPASQRSYASEQERALACARAGNTQTRLVIIDESGNSQSVVSDVAIDCSAYNAPATLTRAVEREPLAAPSQAYITTASTTPQPVLAGPRTIRVAVDGGAERVYALDDVTGTATPVEGYEAPITAPAPQTYQAANRIQSYNTGTYRVRRGDTMYSIARRHCVSLDALSSSSGVYAPYTIDPGQSLRLPRGAC